MRLYENGAGLPRRLWFRLAPYLLERAFSNGVTTSPVLYSSGWITTCLPGLRHWSRLLSATPRNCACTTRGLAHSPFLSQRIGPTIVFTSFACSHAASLW